MAATQHYVEANEKYASQREPVQLPLPPSRHVAVLTCMDARILPEGKHGSCGYMRLTFHQWSWA